jgi:hypothetical protein
MAGNKECAGKFKEVAAKYNGLTSEEHEPFVEKAAQAKRLHKMGFTTYQNIHARRADREASKLQLENASKFSANARTHAKDATATDLDTAEADIRTMLDGKTWMEDNARDHCRKTKQREALAENLKNSKNKSLWRETMAVKTATAAASSVRKCTKRMNRAVLNDYGKDPEKGGAVLDAAIRAMPSLHAHRDSLRPIPCAPLKLATGEVVPLYRIRFIIMPRGILKTAGHLIGMPSRQPIRAKLLSDLQEAWRDAHKEVSSTHCKAVHDTPGVPHARLKKDRPCLVALMCVEREMTTHLPIVANAVDGQTKSFKKSTEHKALLLDGYMVCAFLGRSAELASPDVKDEDILLSRCSEDSDLRKQPPVKLPDGSIWNFLDYCNYEMVSEMVLTRKLPRRWRRRNVATAMSN